MNEAGKGSVVLDAVERVIEIRRGLLPAPPSRDLATGLLVLLIALGVLDGTPRYWRRYDSVLGDPAETRPHEGFAGWILRHVRTLVVLVERDG